MNAPILLDLVLILLLLTNLYLHFKDRDPHAPA